MEPRLGRVVGLGDAQGVNESPEDMANRVLVQLPALSRREQGTRSSRFLASAREILTERTLGRRVQGQPAALAELAAYSTEGERRIR